MTCLLGQSRLWEFQAITPRRRAEACGSHRKTRKRVGRQWEAVEDSGRQVEGPEDVQKWVEDREGAERGAGVSGRGQEVRGRVQKGREGMGM